MSSQSNVTSGGPVQSANAEGASSVVLVCEHASSYIPAHFNNLGLPEDALDRHFVWDPGALALAKAMSDKLDATLIYGTISRLVYDCNRPPHAPDAIPVRGESVDVPGNIDLSPDQKAKRIRDIYDPFHIEVADTIDRTTQPILVTVHSFTSVFHGKYRDTEIGILHDSDARLADAMLNRAAHHTDLNVVRNAPYGPQDGVTHTLLRHAIPNGHLNVMLEVRNDLIETPSAQVAMAEMIANWLADALTQIGAKGAITCKT